MDEARDADDSTSPARPGPSRHRPVVVWLTGLSGAGKTTIAACLEGKLKRMAVPCCVLDGDALRAGLNRDLGFSASDRSENIRRVGEVGRLMVDAGLVVVVALISPFREDRDRVRSAFAAGQFFEVYVDAPLEVLEQRDVKGLYRRARSGELANFTGINAPYEPPSRPELRLDTRSGSGEQAAERVMALLRASAVLGSG